MVTPIVDIKNKKYGIKDAQLKINWTLNLSIKNAGWYGFMNGLADTYLSAFAVFLQATSLQISLLASIPQLCAALLQLFAVRLTNIFKSRKRIVLVFSLAQAILWGLFVLIAFYSNSVWVLILLATCYYTFGALTIPAWTSWIGDLVAEDKRGKFFGKRNRVAGVASFISVIIAGLILDKIQNPVIGFSIIFIFASVGGYLSYMYLSRQFEPIVELREPRKFGLMKFIKSIHKDNFGIFTLYTSFLLFSVYIVSPLFVLYWLDTLNFSYLEYMILLSASGISAFITMTYWGAHADHYGNKIVLSVCSVLIAISPLMWYMTRFVGDLVLVYSIILQVISGFAWAGFNLSTNNFIFDSVKIEDRVRKMSYYSAFRGFAIFFGSVLGGLLAMITITNPQLKMIAPTGFFLVLIISGILRVLVVFMFIDKIMEVKIVDNQPNFLHFVTVMPVQGVIFDSLVGMNRTIKKFKEQLLKIESKLNYLEGDFKKKTKNS